MVIEVCVKSRVVAIKADEAKSLIRAVEEVGESAEEFRKTMLEVRRDASSVRKLWRSENKSTLIKVGLALIAFPDPTISDVVGGALVAAGMVQAGIKRRALSVEDIPKALQSAFSEIKSVKEFR